MPLALTLALLTRTMSTRSSDLQRNGWVRTGVFSLAPASLMALFKFVAFRPRVAVSAALAAGCSGAALYWMLVERKVQASAQPGVCLAASFSSPVYMGMVVATPIVSVFAMMMPLVAAHRVGWVAREAFNIAVRHRRRVKHSQPSQVAASEHMQLRPLNARLWIGHAKVWRPVPDAAVRRQLLTRLFSRQTIREIALSVSQVVSLHSELLIAVVPASLMLAFLSSGLLYPVQYYFFVRMEQ